MAQPSDWSAQKKQLYVLAFLVIVVFIIYTGRQIWLSGQHARPVPAASPAPSRTDRGSEVRGSASVSTLDRHQGTVERRALRQALRPPFPARPALS